MQVIEDLYIIRESCEHRLHVCEEILKWYGPLVIVDEQGTKRLCFFDPHQLVNFAPIVIQ